MKIKRVIFLATFFSFMELLHAQLPPAWVARYNNGVTNGTNQAVKMALDSVGNIYITGYSQNAYSNLGYVTIKYAPNGTQLWVARYDSTNSPSAMPAAMSVDISNNVVVTGSALTVKYDANGNQLWTAPYAGTALTVDRNANVYVVGFSQNFGTVKLSSQGSNLWLTTYIDPAGPTVSQSVLVDNAANVYVAGLDTYYYRSPGGGPYGPYVTLTVIKYDSNANQIWTTSKYPAPSYYKVQIEGSAIDNSNNIYFITDWTDGAPFVTYKFSSSGALIWVAENPDLVCGSDIPNGIAVNNNQEVFVTGQSCYFLPHYSGGTLQYGTYKANINGTWVWTNVFPSLPVLPSVATSIALDKSNNSYVTGFTPGANSSNDVATIKYGPNGNQLWVQNYNGLGNGNDSGNAIAVDKLGNVYVTGYETLPGGGTGIVTIKYPPVTIQKQASGNILLQAQGAPNENFDVQASTNLQTWQDLGLSPADTNGLFQFSDTNAFNARFYIATPQ